MLPLKRFILTCMALLPIACILPSMLGMAPSAPALSVSQPNLFLAPANSTSTPTPFRPLPPTSTYIPTNFPTNTPMPTPTATTTEPHLITKSWEDYPGPSEWPDIDVPAPVGILPQPEGQVNILLLGSDQRPNDGGFRTDTILLLTLNPKAGTANLTSFPRDLYVYIPGWTVQRINTAMGHGGIDLLYDTFEYNFGVHPDHYVFINFWSFQEVIDSLGGVDVQVAVALTDQRDRYGDYTVPAGTVHMDGDLALWYVRARYTTSDFERGKRQQEVLIAIFDKLISLNGITKAPKLYEIYRQNVTTDLEFSDLAPLVPLAAKLTDTSRVNHYFISRNEVVPWLTTQGAQVLIPIREAVLQVMDQALNVPK